MANRSRRGVGKHAPWRPRHAVLIGWSYQTLAEYKARESVKTPSHEKADKRRKVYYEVSGVKTQLPAGRVR